MYISVFIFLGSMEKYRRFWIELLQWLTEINLLLIVSHKKFWFVRVNMQGRHYVCVKTVRIICKYGTAV
jgi:hypothetical protein